MSITMSRVRLSVAIAASLFVPVKLCGAQATAAASLDRVKVLAGEAIRLTVSLEPPLTNGGQVQLSFKNERGLEIGCVSVVSANQTSVIVTCSPPIDDKGGIYTTRSIHWFLYDARDVKGDISIEPLSFEVIPRSTVDDAPRTGKASLNPSQVQILRSATADLTDQITRFRATMPTLSKKPGFQVRAELIRTLFDAKAALGKTEDKYVAAEPSPTTQKTKDQHTFFLNSEQDMKT